MTSRYDVCDDSDCCDDPSHVSGRARCYQGPVAHGDAENQAAHGCITYRQDCLSCGRWRNVNVNGLHSEEGSWNERD